MTILKAVNLLTVYIQDPSFQKKKLLEYRKVPLFYTDLQFIKEMEIRVIL